jgi:hypothetical protein
MAYRPNNLEGKCRRAPYGGGIETPLGTLSCVGLLLAEKLQC